MRIAILSPINNSLYSRVLTWACLQEPGIEVCQVVLRTAWSWKRISGEIRRDGPRLLRKVHQKLVVGEEVVQAEDSNTLSAMARRMGLPGRTLTELCDEMSIPIMTVRDHNDAWAVKALQGADLDAILFTGGGLIRKGILEASQIGVVNCHAGLLPRYRGMDVVEWPILEAGQEKPEVGMTLHLMDRGVDTGPILFKRPIELSPGETFEEVRTHLGPKMVELMMEGVRGLRDGKLTPKTQMKEAGRQYFVMHPRVKAAAVRKLGNKK